MSRVSELAAEEAARAEAEQPEETAGDETEAPAQPSEAEQEEEQQEEEREGEQTDQPPTEAEMRAAMAKLEKEDQRHAKRYAEILGEQFQAMVPCPRCLESGHIFPPDVAPLDEEQVAAVDASLGRADRRNLKRAKDTETCEDCGGEGQVLTGATNPQSLTKACTPCGGLGWVPKGAQSQLSPPAAAPGPQANGGTDAEVVVDLRDGWGRPAGHPHWGQDPAAIGV
jgi:hypothetical protein